LHHFFLITLLAGGRQIPTRPRQGGPDRVGGLYEIVNEDTSFVGVDHPHSFYLCCTLCRMGSKWRNGDWRLEIGDWRLNFCRRWTRMDADGLDGAPASCRPLEGGILNLP